MYQFTRTVLDWQVSDYGLWVTYKNLLAALGSLAAVPLLSAVLNVSDNVLALVGAFSSVFDYVLYGLVTTETHFFIWMAPVAALLVNSCAIAIRAMISKYVASDELGKVSAVLGALDGLMPMISFPLYTAVYYSTIEAFPGAQFFFGGSANLLMALIFILIMLSDRTSNYNVEEAVPPPPEGPVKEKSLVIRKDSRWLYEEDTNNTNTKKIRLATILLSNLNFSIEVPMMEQSLGKPLDTIEEEDGEEEEKEEEEEVGQHESNNVGSTEDQVSASYDNVAYVNDSKP